MAEGEKLVGEQPEPTVVSDDDGTRVVRWSMTGGDGRTFRFEHRYPDALKHLYIPTGIGADVPLYQGEFRLDDDEQPIHGDVRFRWYPRPRIEARGSRETTDNDIAGLLATPSGFWARPSAVRIKLDDSCLPAPPLSLTGPPAGSSQVVAPGIEQELGPEADLERVTFVLPNGWPALDGTSICDPADLTYFWRGRINTGGDGWKVTIDCLADLDSDEWRALADSGGYRFTHVGSLEREDGQRFGGRQSFEVLDRVRVALNLALGRRTTCALPVGWQGHAPVWTRWRSAPVDPYSSSQSHWLDESITVAQIDQVVRCGLEATSDPVAWSAIRPAVAYYTSANSGVDVQLSVSIPVSGLQLLAYYRFVTERGSYSNGRWKDLSTEKQLRMLLSEAGIDLTIHNHFEHLAAVADRLSTTDKQYDALGVVVKMRNVVTHPTRPKPADFSPYEWAEAGMHARYWLCLALLHTVGYHGQIADVLGPVPRWTGQLRSVPW